MCPTCLWRQPPPFMCPVRRAGSPAGRRYRLCGLCPGRACATGVTGLNHKLEDYYHTRRDTYDNMNKEGLAGCFAVSVKALEMFDNGVKQ